MSASTALALSRLARVASGAAASAPTTAGVAAAVSSDLPLLAPRSRLAQSPGSSSMSASTAVALSRLVRAASGAAASTPTTARVVAAASGSSRHDEEASAAGVQMKAVRDGPLTTLLASEFRSRLPLSPMPLSPLPPPRPPPKLAVPPLPPSCRCACRRPTPNASRPPPLWPDACWPLRLAMSAAPLGLAQGYHRKRGHRDAACSCRCHAAPSSTRRHR